MRVKWLPDVAPGPRRLALGMFDGVHLGHAAVIAGMDTVVSFEPHPRAVVGSVPELITDLPTKAQRLAALGVRELVLIPFNRRAAEMRAERFVDDVLVGSLGAEAVSVGTNFRFGHRAAGTAELLRRDRRFRTRIVALVEREGGVVSSSRIRELIARGDVTRAARLLGAPFRLRCTATRVCGQVTLRWGDGLVRPLPGVYSARLCGRRRALGVEVLDGPGDAFAKVLGHSVPEGQVVVDLLHRCRDQE
jgi:riboflavin kinase/FMN adenylyltransferase